MNYIPEMIITFLVLGAITLIMLATSPKIDLFRFKRKKNKDGVSKEQMGEMADNAKEMVSDKAASAADALRNMMKK